MSFWPCVRGQWASSLHRLNGQCPQGRVMLQCMPPTLPVPSYPLNFVTLNTQTTDFIQEDTTKLQEWDKKWQLQFIEEKCKVLHLGRGNPAQEIPYGKHSTVHHRGRERKSWGSNKEILKLKGQTINLIHQSNPSAAVHMDSDVTLSLVIYVPRFFCVSGG